jgi:hypothetical protein
MVRKHAPYWKYSVFWRSGGEQFLWSTAAAILNHRNNYLNPFHFQTTRVIFSKGAPERTSLDCHFPGQVLSRSLLGFERLTAELAAMND